MRLYASRFLIFFIIKLIIFLKFLQIKCWYPRIIVYDVLKSGSIDGVTKEAHDKAVIRALNSKYYPNNKVKGIPENTIFITRLNKDTTEDELKDVGLHIWLLCIIYYLLKFC